MIKGYFKENGEPRLGCTISIPALGIRDHALTMLVSTGTAFTTLHPQDAQTMGIDPSAFHRQGYTNPTVSATLTFKDNENPPVPITLHHLKIMNPVHRYMKPTSVLGMDILRRWNMIYSYPDRSLTFHTAE